MTVELPRPIAEASGPAESHGGPDAPVPLPVRPADLTGVRPIRWAWDRRLPLGYLSLLLGAEGVGKGTLSAWIIARITRGELPGDLDGQPGRVLIIGDEDLRLSFCACTQPAPISP